MKYFVVDASLILKTILKEDESVARKLRSVLEKVKHKKVELISVKLLKSEVANGIRFGEKKSELGLRYFEAIWDLPIKYMTLSKIQMKNCLRLSYDLDTTVYDTSYHVLAKVHNAVFLTCDEKYYEKAKGLGDIELIR